MPVCLRARARAAARASRVAAPPAAARLQPRGMRNAVVCWILAALVLGLLVSRWAASSGVAPDGMAEELARLRYANALLQSRLEQVEALKQTAEGAVRAEAKCKARLARVKDRQQRPLLAEGCPPAEPSGNAISKTAQPVRGGDGAPNISAQLLHAHAQWDWKAIVSELLQPWPRVELAQLETAVAACNDNGTMYCSRMQIIDGSLYLTDYRAIFFDRHYAPARVMPLLETLRRHPELPNMDLVVAGNDEPRVPAIPGERWIWGRTCKRWPGGSDRKKAPPAIFASTTNRGVMDLPWVGMPMWGWIPD